MLTVPTFSRVIRQMKKTDGIYLLSFTVILMGVTSCGKSISIPVVKKAPPGYSEVMGNKKRIGIILGNVQSVTGMNQSDYRASIETETVNAVQKAGYFTIVDIESRKKRLEEIAVSQSGITNEVKNIGQEISADGLLYISATQPPRAECRVISEQIREQVCVATDANKNCLRYAERVRIQNTGKLTVSLGVSGKLVNIETGRSLQHSYNDTTEISSSAGVSNCPSVLEGISKASKAAGKSIAEGVSPVVEEMDIPIYDDPDGVDKALQGNVQEQLKTGLKWADNDSKDYTSAADSWKKALQLSNGKSVSANWNLAVYEWSRKNYTEADRYFQTAFRLGGPEYMTSKRRDVYSKFQEERRWNEGQ